MSNLREEYSQISENFWELIEWQEEQGRTLPGTLQ